MTDQASPQESHSDFKFTIDNEIIKESLLSATERALKEGKITPSFVDKMDEFTSKTDIKVRLSVRRDLMDANTSCVSTRLIKVDQMENLNWTSNFFDIMLSLAMAFFGAFVGYVSGSGFNTIATLLLIFSVVLIVLTVYLWRRKEKLNQEMLSDCSDMTTHWPTTCRRSNLTPRSPKPT